MKKQFVVPAIREEAALARLTLTPVCSDCNIDN